MTSVFIGYSVIQVGCVFFFSAIFRSNTITLVMLLLPYNVPQGEARFNIVFNNKKCWGIKNLEQWIILPFFYMLNELLANSLFLKNKYNAKLKILLTIGKLKIWQIKQNNDSCKYEPKILYAKFCRSWEENIFLRNIVPRAEMF